MQGAWQVRRPDKDACLIDRISLSDRMRERLDSMGRTSDVVAGHRLRDVLEGRSAHLQHQTDFRRNNAGDVLGGNAPRGVDETELLQQLVTMAT